MSSKIVESRQKTILGVLTGGNFVHLGVRLLLSPVIPYILAEFDATKSDIGVALSGMWVIFALLQFPSGVLTDKYSERPVLLAGLGGAVVGTALVAFAPTLPFFAVFVLVLGAGVGLFFAPASSLILRLYEKQGRALGTMTAGGAVAGIIYPAVGSLVAVRFGWRLAIAFGTVTVLPLFLATAQFIPSMDPANPERSFQAALDVDRIRNLLTRPSVAYTTIIAVMVGFSFQALSSFFPTFLVEYRGIDTGVAGLLFGAIFGLSSLAQPVAGWISDRFSRDAAIALSVVVAGAGLVVLLAVGETIGLIVGTGLLGLGISWPGPIQARFMDQLTESERGYGFGLVRTVYLLIAASGSVVVGSLAERSGWIAGYGAVVMLFAVCLFALGVNQAFSLEL